MLAPSTQVGAAPSCPPTCEHLLQQLQLPPLLRPRARREALLLPPQLPQEGHVALQHLQQGMQVGGVASGRLIGWIGWLD